jgi:hypothetical protein
MFLNICDTDIKSIITLLIPHPDLYLGCRHHHGSRVASPKDQPVRPSADDQPRGGQGRGQEMIRFLAF